MYLKVGVHGKLSQLLAIYELSFRTAPQRIQFFLYCDRLNKLQQIDFYLIHLLNVMAF